MLKVAVLLAVVAVASAGYIHGAAGGVSTTSRAQDDFGNYRFNYQIVDPLGASNSRWEAGDAHGNQVGSYTIRDIDGRARNVNYVADGAGFRAKIHTNEPGTASSLPAAAVLASSQPGIPAVGPATVRIAHTAPVAAVAHAPVAAVAHAPVAAFAHAPVAAFAHGPAVGFGAGLGFAGHGLGHFGGYGFGHLGGYGFGHLGGYGFKGFHHHWLNYCLKTIALLTWLFGKMRAVNSPEIQHTTNEASGLLSHRRWRQDIHLLRFLYPCTKLPELHCFYTTSEIYKRQCNSCSFTYCISFFTEVKPGLSYFEMLKVAVLLAVVAVASAGYIHGAAGGVSTTSRAQDDFGNYRFNYHIVDPLGASNSRWEAGDAHGNQVGSYTIRDIDGRARNVNYVADGAGFRAKIHTNEPGTASSLPAAAVVASSQPGIPAVGPATVRIAHTAPVAAVAHAPVAAVAHAPVAAVAHGPAVGLAGGFGLGFAGHGLGYLGGYGLGHLGGLIHH
ncbi:uncharacterized protein LOC143236220 [Tachypleus tridentatus]|uniref:uncharacterized protein LOC143236220 n=1 Tax=Tachypleus tridentatus TaxID=6853 RepID=UPI003FD5722F